MKESRITTAIIIVMFIALVGSYVAGFLIYKDYRKKVALFDRQIRFSRNRFIESQNELGKLYSRLTDIENSSKKERGTILSKINNLEYSIKTWQNEYTTALSNIAGKVDLGEISVKE
ncbi:hypothetical protein ACFL0P_00795 [Candidatus Omnitrophota bacterium]